MEGQFSILTEEFGKSTCNYSKIGQILAELSPLLHTNLQKLNQQELAMCRDIFEIGVFWSVRIGDFAAFHRYFAQLLPFYFDSHLGLPISSRMTCVLGLNLMYLLTFASVKSIKLSDFHVFLAKIPKNIKDSSPHVQFPIQLEQCLTEGIYNRVLIARDQVPAPEFAVFIDSIMETIRDDIAKCLGKSCSSMKQGQVLKMLLLSQNDTAYLSKVIESNNWKSSDDLIIFNQASLNDPFIDPKFIIKESLKNAQEIEQFV